MTSEHYLREIAELLKEMNLRLARIEARVGPSPELKSPRSSVPLTMYQKPIK